LNTTEQYLAALVTVLFVAGVGLLIAAFRQRNRARKQWS
jgi:hypothetical protein